MDSQTTELAIKKTTRGADEKGTEVQTQPGAAL